MKKEQIVNLIILTIFHFLSDLVCAINIINSKDYQVFIIYNSLAFLLQAIIGVIIDHFHHEKELIIISLFFLFFISNFINNIYLLTILLGISNALFHVCAGSVISKESNNNPVHLGIFVSSGALAISLAIFIPNKSFIIYLTLLLPLVLLINNNLINRLENTNINIDLILIILLVLMRSFISNSTNTFNTYDLLLISIFIFFGKALGGYLNKFNIYKVLLITIIASFLTSLFNNSLILTIISKFLINLTMPLTLYLMNHKLKPYYGTSFGLLAASLLIGYIINQLTFYYSLIASIACLIISILDIIILERRN